MATKSFKDICIEYATQLGKGLPLTPAEMCNAVIMYLNQQVTDMNQMVQTALNAVKDVQDDIAEGEYATLGANNVFRGNNSFSQTVQANGGVTINGENVATENDIPSYTEFSGVTYSQEEGAEISYGNNKINLPIIGGDNININADSTGTHLQISAEDVASLSKYQTFTNFNVFERDNETTANIKVSSSVAPDFILITNDTIEYSTGNHFNRLKFQPSDDRTVENFLPNKGGTIALLSDIPDLDNYTGTVHIVQGTAGGGVAVHDTAVASPYTKYGYDKIETYGNSNTLQYTLNIPEKNGTLATLDDIPVVSPKYFTRVICHDANNDTQYIFSCITEGDLSGNNVYGDVVSLLTELGAINSTTMLPCSGKTASGGAVIGVYTDGSAITVFGGDNATEEIPTSAEINIISK